jgi:hypothetical protein
MLRVAELRDIDLALASYPEAEWAELAGPLLLLRLRPLVGIGEDELRGAVRRSLLLAAAAGDPADALATSEARAVQALAEEVGNGDRRRALADAIRGDLARATGSHLPRAASVLRQLAAPEDHDPQLAWRLFCAALLAAAALEE